MKVCELDLRTQVIGFSEPKDIVMTADVLMTEEKLVRVSES